MRSSLALPRGGAAAGRRPSGNKGCLQARPNARGVDKRGLPRHSRHSPVTPQAAAGFPSSGSQPEPDSAGPSSSSSTAAVTRSLAHLWPKVSWSRYHLQVLFVDQTDTVRGRLAAGLFERCAEWNGYGRALYPWSAGLAPGGPRDIHAISKLTALMRGASNLEILPRYFTRPPEAFELEDLDRYDLVLALDRSVHAALHASIAAEYPPGPDRDYYTQKVCLLTTFSHYESDAVLTRRGGFALLPAQLSYLLKDGAGGLAASKAVVDIPSPDLSSPDGAAQWEAVVAALILSTASLVKYLVDAYPENMPHYDPQD